MAIIYNLLNYSVATKMNWIILAGPFPLQNTFHVEFVRIKITKKLAILDFQSTSGQLELIHGNGTIDGTCTSL